MRKKAYYLRKPNDGMVVGPLPESRICELVIQGRIGLAVEVSENQTDWISVRTAFPAETLLRESADASAAAGAGDVPHESPSAQKRGKAIGGQTGTAVTPAAENDPDWWDRIKSFRWDRVESAWRDLARHIKVDRRLLNAAVGVVGVCLVLFMGWLVFRVVGSFGNRQAKFATNTSEARTTAQWIEFIREVQASKRGVIRTGAYTDRRNEAAQAAAAVDFDPAATADLLGALEGEREVQEFARTVLAKALTAERPPRKDAVLARLKDANRDVRSWAIRLLGLLPGEAEARAEWLASDCLNYGGQQVKLAAMSVLATLPGGAEQHYDAFCGLEAGEQRQVLTDIADYPEAKRAARWFEQGLEGKNAVFVGALTLRVKGLPEETQTKLIFAAIDQVTRESDIDRVLGSLRALGAEIVEPLIERLDHDHKVVRQLAARALLERSQVLRAEHVPQLVRAIQEHKGSQEQRDLLKTLAAMGPVASSAAPELARSPKTLSNPEQVVATLLALGLDNTELQPDGMADLLSFLGPATLDKVPADKKPMVEPPAGELELLETFTTKVLLARLSRMTLKTGQETIRERGRGAGVFLEREDRYADDELAVVHNKRIEVTRVMNGRDGQRQEQRTDILSFSQHSPQRYDGCFVSLGNWDIKSKSGLSSVQPTGSWKFHYPNGGIRCQGAYHSGVRSGRFVVSDERGARRWEGQFHEGRLVAGVEFP